MVWLFKLSSLDFTVSKPLILTGKHSRCRAIASGSLQTQADDTALATQITFSQKDYTFLNENLDSAAQLCGEGWTRDGFHGKLCD